MKIEIDDYEIISSGTIIGVVDKPIIFQIEDLVFEFQFKDNKEHNEQKLTPEIPPDGKKMIFYFENFNNSLGTGNKIPLKVGFVNDRSLFLNYRLYSLSDDAGKLLHYTWLLEKKKGGQNG